MDLEESILAIQLNLLHWFNDNGRYWIPWKIKPDGAQPKSGEMLS